MRRFVTERGRRPAFLGLVLALFLALPGVGYAAKNPELTVGKINQASKGTTLRSKGGPTLTLTNTGGKPAARFNVLQGKPPFAVSSRVKVIGLNADLLDGIDSSSFQLRVTGSCAAGSAIRVVNADGRVVCASTLSAGDPGERQREGAHAGRCAGDRPATRRAGERG